jgi:hypothetical protein
METFADIEGPVRIGFPWLWILLGLLVVAALALVARILMARRRRRPVAASAPRRSPLEIALERLGRLRSADAALEAEPFTVEVSDIVRDYLEAALKIPAREQTSEEFLSALQENPDLPAILHQHMPAFLEHCDRVKFARQALAEEQRTSLLQTAGTVVESTDAHLHPLAGSAQPATSAP